MSGIADVPDVVGRIADLLAKLGIRHAFGGAIAQNYWGVVRATQDVDVLASIPALRLPEVIAALMADGFRRHDEHGAEGAITLPDVRATQAKYGLFAVWFGVVKVEIFSPQLPLQHRMLDRARPMPWRTRAVPVTTPEDLILIKMVFHRDKDLRDIRAMVATSGPTLDVAYIEERAGEVLDIARREELRRLLASRGAG